jgi:hypothetical protein
MKLTDQHHDWIRHSISLTAALVNMNQQARNTLYTPPQQALQAALLDAKRETYSLMRGNLTMTAYQQRVAAYLMAYADAHIYFQIDGGEFPGAMNSARLRLHQRAEGAAA